MKVHDSNIVNLPEVRKVEKSFRNEPAKASGDVVDISSRAADMQGAVERAKNAPDTREEKVRLLKEEIDRGMYNVRGRNVAEKLIESVFEK